MTSIKANIEDQNKDINSAWKELTEALADIECNRIDDAKTKLQRMHINDILGYTYHLISDFQSQAKTKADELDCDVNYIKMELGNITDELDLAYDLIDKALDLTKQAQSDLDDQSPPELTHVIEHLEAVASRQDQPEYHAQQIESGLDSIDRTLIDLKALT